MSNPQSTTPGIINVNPQPVSSFNFTPSNNMNQTPSGEVIKSQMEPCVGANTQPMRVWNYDNGTPNQSPIQSPRKFNLTFFFKLHYSNQYQSLLAIYVAQTLFLFSQFM